MKPLFSYCRLWLAFCCVVAQAWGAAPLPIVLPCPPGAVEKPAGQDTLLRFKGDAATWAFTISPKVADVNIAVTEWKFDGKVVTGDEANAGEFSAAGWGAVRGGAKSNSVTWSAPTKAATFSVSVKFKRWCGGNGKGGAGGEIPEEEVSWGGEVKSLKIKLTPDPEKVGDDLNDAMCGVDGTKSVKAHVYNEANNQPEPDVFVQFTTSRGSISGGVSTNAAGDAIATLTSKNAVGKDVGAGNALVKATLEGGEEASLTIYMISSAITLSGNPYSFCNVDAPPFLLSVSPIIGGNPPQQIPITYTWSVSAGQNKVEFVSATNKTFVQCRGLIGSAPSQKDVKIRLETSLHGTTCIAFIEVAILQPTSIDLVAQKAPTQIMSPGTPPQSIGYGFWGQTRTFEIRDQNGRAMPQVTMNEDWDNRRPAPNATWDGPDNVNWKLSGADGRQIDYFGMYDMPLQPNPVVTLRQRLWAGSNVSQQGCGPLQTFPNVQYTLTGAINF